MGCGNSPTNNDIQQISASWSPIPSDKQYEEKVVQLLNGSITRMTAVVGQRAKDNEYPHYTEFFKSDGEKRGFYSDKNSANWKGPTLWDSHYTTPNGEHTGTHRTAQSTLEDLNEAISSMRAERK